MAAPRDLKGSLGAALEDHRRRRNRNAPARAANAKKDKPKKPAAPGTMVNQLVSPFAQQHGEYRVSEFTLKEEVREGKVKTTSIRVVRNFASTVVERWASRGKLDERQMAAVLFYQDAWRTHIGEPRVTANYSPAVARFANAAIELYAGSRIAAKESLRLLDQEVFFRRPVEDFEVWQNVVIWDEAAGVAGGRIGYTHKPAEAVAQFIVVRIAGEIADIVIDQSRRDFGDLILDLDAPRRPGRRGS